MSIEFSGSMIPMILISTLIATNWIMVCAYILLFDRNKKLLRDLKNEKLNNRQMSDYINSKKKGL